MSKISVWIKERLPKLSRKELENLSQSSLFNNDEVLTEKKMLEMLDFMKTRGELLDKFNGDNS